MRKLLLILLFKTLSTGIIFCQSFDMDDLVKLSALPQKNIDRFMLKKHFSTGMIERDSNFISRKYTEQIKDNSSQANPRIVEIYSRQCARFFNFHTFSYPDYLDARQRLIKAGFFYDVNKDQSTDSNILFQKLNLRVLVTTTIIDSIPRYSFIMEEKEIPPVEKITYAEDLLRFTSNEYLVSFFGAQNVTRDQYYFSEKELKKCSVLFLGTSRQAMFVWEDENNLDILSYILVTNVIPTEAGRKVNLVTGNNRWPFKSGIHTGMSVNELLELNGEDFKIYGNTSDLAWMIKPDSPGKINFKNTAILFNCINCNSERILAKPDIAAREVESQNLPMYVHDIVLYPQNK